MRSYPRGGRCGTGPKKEHSQQSGPFVHVHLFIFWELHWAKKKTFSTVRPQDLFLFSEEKNLNSHAPQFLDNCTVGNKWKMNKKTILPKSFWCTTRVAVQRPVPGRWNLQNDTKKIKKSCLHRSGAPPASPSVVVPTRNQKSPGSQRAAAPEWRDWLVWVWRRIHCTPPEYICSIYSQIINEYVCSIYSNRLTCLGVEEESLYTTCRSTAHSAARAPVLCVYVCM